MVDQNIELKWCIFTMITAISGVFCRPNVVYCVRSVYNILEMDCACHIAGSISAIALFIFSNGSYSLACCQVVAEGLFSVLTMTSLVDKYEICGPIALVCMALSFVLGCMMGNIIGRVYGILIAMPFVMYTFQFLLQTCLRYRGLIRSESCKELYYMYLLFNVLNILICLYVFPAMVFRHMIA